MKNQLMGSFRSSILSARRFVEEVDIERAAEKNLRAHAEASCEECEGTGKVLRPKAPPLKGMEKVKCPTCGGSGKKLTEMAEPGWQSKRDAAYGLSLTAHQVSDKARNGEATQEEAAKAHEAAERAHKEMGALHLKSVGGKERPHCIIR